MMSDSEMDDFEAAIVAAGFEVDDFNVVPLEDKPPQILHTITGTVTVHRISTDEVITYSGGHGSTWVVDFLADFYAGKFGQP